MDDFLNETAPLARVNFKSCIYTFVSNLEALFLHQTEYLKQTVDSLMDRIGRRRQKIRPNRSYQRISMKPVGKWRSSKTTNQLIAIAA